MSFLKKLSEKITPPKVSVTINLKKDVYYLGEKLEGELILSSDDDFDADEVRCELACVESARVQKRIYNPNLKHEVPVETWETATLYQAKPCLSGPMHISRGFTRNFPFSITLPVTMKPTSKGVDRKISWSIKGVVAVKGRPDATSRTVEVQVAQPSAAPITKEVIREVVMVPCKYCGTLFPQTEITCPHCGANRTA